MKGAKKAEDLIENKMVKGKALIEDKKNWHWK
jgi:hypothetical protein